MESPESQDPKNPDYYDFGNGNGMTLSEYDKKVMHPNAGIKGFEWHPSGVNPKTNESFLKHHTMIHYMSGCRNCLRMHKNGIHPNGNRENLRD